VVEGKKAKKMFKVEDALLVSQCSLGIILPELAERLVLSDQEHAGREGETRPKAFMAITCGSSWLELLGRGRDRRAVRVTDLEGYL
jgi:hypothetical protein